MKIFAEIYQIKCMSSLGMEQHYFLDKDGARQGDMTEKNVGALGSVSWAHMDAREELVAVNECPIHNGIWFRLMDSMLSQGYFLDQNGKHNYQLIELIGSGAFGLVYLARMDGQTEFVAWKVIPVLLPASRFSTWKELNIELLSLSHVNVVRYYAGGSCDSSAIEPKRWILVMEYCSGL